MNNWEEILKKLNTNMTPALAILLLIAGILLLYQFLIVIVGPCCIAIGIWYLWSFHEQNKNKNDTE
tara:strand:+ start:317 stop:514 length:198 start_codon:yes stop_codon:yes gene_type:complete